MIPWNINNKWKRPQLYEDGLSPHGLVVPLGRENIATWLTLMLGNQQFYSR